METGLTIKSLMNRDDIKTKFQEMLGKKAQGFITSVLQIVASSKSLQNADPLSIYNAAATAATLDLPINNNLGFAWIVPYTQKYKEKDDKGKDVWKQKQVAQFQMGWKGFVQLALRTGQYNRINVVKVYENQFKSYNALTEDLDCDFNLDGKGAVVGYVAYFRLNTGFEKLCYWSKAAMEKHGKKYSKSYDTGVWTESEDGFDSMGLKTAIKNTLSKWGIMSIEMQTAIKADQALINNEDASDVTYIDNEPTLIDKELERKQLLLADCQTVEQLELIQVNNPDWEYELFETRKKEINGGK